MDKIITYLTIFLLAIGIIFALSPILYFWIDWKVVMKLEASIAWLFIVSLGCWWYLESNNSKKDI